MSNVAHLDFNQLGFSIRSDQVMNAREDNWYATTPFGIAVLRFEDASTLLKDRRLYQGTRKWPEHYGITDGPLASWWKSMLLSVEGDDHLRLRRLSNPAFSPKTIEPMAPFFESLANELIDNFQSRGECEFMSEFAEPFSARVITGILGLDESLWPKVADLATKLGYVFSVTIKEDLEMIEEGLVGILDLAQDLIDSREGSDRDDFIGTLLKADVDGVKITEEELLSLISLLIFAGFDTTRNQIGLGMQTFSEHPDQWQLLAQKPELARIAVEEVMRVNPTITWVSREASVDIEHKGLTIKQGTTIHLLTIPAGSDPRKFASAGFNITADHAPHFGFGGGMHHCIGHYVARLDMKEAFKALSRRLPNMKIATVAAYLPDSGNTGPTVLPITFTASSIQ